METRKKIGVWAKENDLESKIKAALEQIVVGQGWDVFDGLQDRGECDIKLVYHGVNVSFHKLERLEPQELKLEHVAVDAELGSVSGPVTSGPVTGPDEPRPGEPATEIGTVETITAEDVGTLPIVSSEVEKADSSESDKPGKRRRRKDEPTEKPQGEAI